MQDPDASLVQEPSRPDKAKTVSGAMIVLGAALLWPIPLGGALLLAAGSLGLAIAPEGSASRSTPT